MARTFVMGDIHGAFRALKQCLERAHFDYENDRLISLGDVCDGWPETSACIDELLKIKNLIYVLGNHDWWALEWMTTGMTERIWFAQGGEATILSYPNGIPEDHIKFLGNALPYFELADKVFVHGGFDGKIPIQQQGLDTFLWNRTLARMAMEFTARGLDAKLTTYEEAYVGHTPIEQDHPMRACDVWLMDTGAGWSGVLSMMEVTTKEVFVSDPVPSLYPGVVGRTRK
jgi:serine/threonine protein phosphatase 1